VPLIRLPLDVVVFGNRFVNEFVDVSVVSVVVGVVLIGAPATPVAIVLAPGAGMPLTGAVGSPAKSEPVVVSAVPAVVEPVSPIPVVPVPTGMSSGTTVALGLVPPSVPLPVVVPAPVVLMIGPMPPFPVLDVVTRPAPAPVTVGIVVTGVVVGGGVATGRTGVAGRMAVVGVGAAAARGI